jgi:hypothetical protein
MMGVLRWLHCQITDLITAFVLPLFGALLPARLTKSLFWRLAAWPGLFPGRYPSARRSARHFYGRAGELPRTWAWTTLMEAAETWRLKLGLSPRLDVEGSWPDRPGFVAASLHYGIGTGVLWHLREAGLSPRFVFRPVVRGDLPGRPILLAWYRLRTRLIERLCPAGAITTGGARQEIARTLEQGDATPVILFDAPDLEGRWQLEIGRAHLGLRAGGTRLIEQSGARTVFFHVQVDRQSGRSRLAIEALPGHEGLGAQLAARMQAVIEADPGQWLLWHGIEGLYPPRAADTEQPPVPPGGDSMPRHSDPLD